MKVNLYYRYSKLDKVHEYQIVSDLPRGMGVSQESEVMWYQWLWFHLGALFKGKELKRMFICPYSISDVDNKTLRIYENQGDAKQTATWIYRRIMTHYKKQIKRRSICRAREHASCATNTGSW